MGIDKECISLLLARDIPAHQLFAQCESGQSLTYGDVCAYTQKLADIACSQRHLAFILSRNTIGSLASYMACLESQACVPLMLDKGLDTSSLQGLLEQYQPRFVFAPADHEICGHECGQNGWSQAAHIADYVLLDTHAPDCHLAPELALLLTTSGSTGTSKLVRLSYDNICANAASIAEYLEIDEAERPITSLPMSYTYGLSVINSHALMGACLVLTDQTIMQQGFWDALRTAGATSIAGVPYTYQMLQRLRFTEMNLPTLRTMTQAGGKLSADLHQFFAQFAADTNRRFFVMYGQTEATARMSYLPFDHALEKIGSIGIAIPGGSFSLIDVDGSDINQANIEGELVYHGPNVSLGYAQCRDDLAKPDENNGVLVTGDMAKQDEDGYFYITGRKKRFLKLFGKRTSLDECEQQLTIEFGIECACAGRDDLLCVYLLNDDLATQVRTWLALKLGVHPSCITTKVIDAIPRSDSGKIQYKDLPTCE